MSLPSCATLIMLEERLLDPQVRGDRDALSSLVRDDFTEIGSTGRTYDKPLLIEMLTAEKHVPRETPC